MNTSTSAPPPDLPGYQFIRPLGQGGFADVYLYRQNMPSREVAVKVLRQAARTDADRSRFENEADRMAMLSSHPTILTIYEVGVSPDDRPYLTMEYCPHDHFGRLARDQGLSVARGLEVGVKVAGAVETAHGAHILHRDLKPANILMTAYREPALTDFGIAGGRDGDSAESQGVSIAYAAPEVLREETSGNERSDVYALGATVYALVAGRSPFTDRSVTSDADLVERTLRAPLVPTGRLDAPDSLERVLATALSRDPAMRYASAAAFGRALQGVEVELGLPPTALRVIDDADTAPMPARARDEADEDSTRYRSIQRVSPDRPALVTGPSRSRTPPPPSIPTVAPEPARRPTSERDALRVPDEIEGHTVQRAPVPAADPAPAFEAMGVEIAATRRRNRMLATLGGGIAAVLLVGVIIFLAGRGDGDGGPTTTTAPDSTALVLPDNPLSPSELAISVDTERERTTIAWKPRDRQPDDRYRVQITTGPARLGEALDSEETSIEIDTIESVCVVVITIRGSAASTPTDEVCSDGP